MSQVVYDAMIVALFALSLTSVASVPANQKSTLKIVNSTNIRELKHNFAAEDKSGAVAYVYPVGSEDSAQKSWLATASLPKTEAGRTAVPKTFSSQLKGKSAALKEGKEDTETSVSSGVKLLTSMDSAGDKKEDASETAKRDTTQSKGTNTKTTPQNATTTASSPTNTQGNQTTASDNGKPECVTRVESDDDKLIVYNATVQEVEAMGYQVFDIVCKDDSDWDKVISAGALASLCCGSG